MQIVVNNGKTHNKDQRRLLVTKANRTISNVFQ